MVQSTLTRKSTPVASPSLSLAGTTDCQGGDPIHPPQTKCLLWQNCSALDCTEQGSIQAVICEGWGPATLIPPYTSSQRDIERQKREKNEREEGGRLHLKRTIIRVRRNGGGKKKRQWGKVQNGWNRMRLCCSLFFYLFTIHLTWFLPFVTYLFINAWLQWLFHATFDISGGILGCDESICGPRWINLTGWPILYIAWRKHAFIQFKMT